MASPVIQPATLHAIRQGNMAVHIRRLSIFQTSKQFSVCIPFCHENTTGKQNSSVLPQVSWILKAINTQLDFTFNVKDIVNKIFPEGEGSKEHYTQHLCLNSSNIKKNKKNNKKNPSALREMLPVKCDFTLQESDADLIKKDSRYHLSNFIIYVGDLFSCLAA